MKPTYYTVAAIACNKNKYLILRRAKGRKNEGEWNSVTGYVKEGEEIGNAALRELKEETNLKGKLIKVGNPFVFHFPERDIIVTACLIEVYNISNFNLDLEEHNKFEWVSREDKRIDKTIAVRRFLESLDL